MLVEIHFRRTRTEGLYSGNLKLRCQNTFVDSRRLTAFAGLRRRLGGFDRNCMSEGYKVRSMNAFFRGFVYEGTDADDDLARR